MTNPPIDLTGQVAIITGGGGGIGRAIAFTLPVDGGAWASSGWVRDSQQKWALIETPSVKN